MRTTPTRAHGHLALLFALMALLATACSDSATGPDPRIRPPM